MDRVKIRTGHWFGLIAVVLLAFAAFAAGAPRGVTPATAFITDSCEDWWECTSDNPDGDGGDAATPPTGDWTQPGEVIEVVDTAPGDPPVIQIMPDSGPPPCTSRPGYIDCIPPWCDPRKLDLCEPIRPIPPNIYTQGEQWTCPPGLRADVLAACEKKTAIQEKSVALCRQARIELRKLKSQVGEIIRRLRNLGWSGQAIATAKGGLDSRVRHWESEFRTHYCDYKPPGSDEQV